MKKRRWWYIGGSALLVLCAVTVWRLTGHAEKIEYRFDKVDRGDVSVSISATGTLSAVTTVQVGSQVSGTIAKLHADFNSVVKKGQLLAQLDPTFLQASVNEARANLDRAKAQVDDAQRTYTRTSGLFSKELVSQSDMDAATTTLQTSKASLKQNQAALDRADVNLHYATILAPISGTVISRNVDVGQTVAASLSAPTLFTIANDMRKMQVQASVDEADIGNVTIGQDVTFRVDAFPDREFHGVVSQVRLAPVVTQNVVTYSVIIDVNNPDLKLMPGMTATVSIEVAAREGVLRVPLLAIRFTPPEVPREGFPVPPKEGVQGPTEPDSAKAAGRPHNDRRWAGRGGRRDSSAAADPPPDADRRAQMMRRVINKARVWVMEDGKPKPVMVTRGLQNTRYVEIMDSDLKVGDEVMIGATGGPQQGNGPAGQTNPFQQPRMGGGGPGRRGGM